MLLQFLKKNSKEIDLFLQFPLASDEPSNLVSTVSHFLLLLLSSVDLTTFDP